MVNLFELITYLAMRGSGRRMSTSEGEGDRLSSTLNLPEAARFNRFDNIDSNRYVSTPQINVTGFIDDNLESSRGGCGLNPGSALGRGQLQTLLMQD